MKQILLFLLFISVVCSQAAEIKEKPLLAVMDIADNSGTLEAFASGIPDMLITELVRKGKYRIVERSQIQQAMKSLQLENSGLTRESKMKIGEWLGADQLLIGVINHAGSIYRLDVRVIDVATGEIRDAAKVSKPASQILEMISGIANQLNRLAVTNLIPKQLKPKKVPVVIPKRNFKTGTLQFSFKVTLSLFTERATPVQLVRIYIDDELIATSSPINKINHSFELAQIKISKGNHMIRMEHGVMGKGGQWKKLMESQPRVLEEYIHENRTYHIKYRMEVGVGKDHFSKPKMKESNT